MRLQCNDKIVILYVAAFISFAIGLVFGSLDILPSKYADLAVMVVLIPLGMWFIHMAGEMEIEKNQLDCRKVELTKEKPADKR